MRDQMCMPDFKHELQMHLQQNATKKTMCNVSFTCFIVSTSKLLAHHILAFL
jgi:hypothetical protein